ncbi:unnamed protein product [Arctogadus glacialis]
MQDMDPEGEETEQLLELVEVITLGLAGGADAKDTVWRILKQAIKNDLAKKISWWGMNGKISFENLHLKAVVMDAVRRNPSCSTATDVQIAVATLIRCSGPAPKPPGTLPHPDPRERSSPRLSLTLTLGNALPEAVPHLDPRDRSSPRLSLTLTPGNALPWGCPSP